MLALWDCSFRMNSATLELRTFGQSSLNVMPIMRIRVFFTINALSRHELHDVSTIQEQR